MDDCGPGPGSNDGWFLLYILAIWLGVVIAVVLVAIWVTTKVV